MSTEVGGKIIPTAEQTELQDSISAVASTLDALLRQENVEEKASTMAEASRVLREASERLLCSSGAVSALNGVSGREIALRAGVNHDTMRRALARSETLAPFAEGQGRRRVVSKQGIDQARASLGLPPLGGSSEV